MSVLLIAEHHEGVLKSGTLNALSAASSLGTEVEILVVGQGAGSVAEELAAFAGVSRILIADARAYADHGVENTAALVTERVKTCAYGHVVAASTAYGKNLLPRVAALLDVAQISDVVEILSANTFVRPYYAGNALATVESSDAVKVMTVRTTAFAAAEKAMQLAPIETTSVAHDTGLSKFLSADFGVSDRVELTCAKVIISGGRGMGSGENFAMLEKVADKLGGAVGASRAAVDAGFVSNDLQVGQTGKIVAPDLYIAVGISGAIQHLAGMKDSKIIVAINKDEDAPIFRVADYGLVADLFEAVPALEAALS
ncbi:FAD-binding protein [Pseudomonas sp. B21-056]|jgi:electron transfer flavoprotein alpha subunit|uniref:electron transfer flavoprotein subunit alpha/FixB family protein n=1 Tax=Pseudomonas sp. B21-056 TaxID=2895495 RepID=UPI002231B389|nr:FAD-binding protein [Pseudomonas sp. B21-056]UZE26054.1 FAD-binding protein [Pseudomonas sp. B21-056]